MKMEDNWGGGVDARVALISAEGNCLFFLFFLFNFYYQWFLLYLPVYYFVSSEKILSYPTPPFLYEPMVFLLFFILILMLAIFSDNLHKQ